MGGGAGHEDFIGNPQFGAVNGSLDRGNAEFALGQLHHRVAGDADEDVVVAGWGVDHAVVDDEDVFTAALGDMAVVVEHDRLVEAGGLGFGLGQGGVDVDAGDLGADGDRGVFCAAPGGGDDMHAAFGVEVGAPGDQEGEEVLGDAVQADAERVLRLVDHRADVEVLAEAGALHELDGHRAEFVVAERQFHQQGVRGLAQALVVLAHAEDVELLGLGVPVGADALEDSGAVVQRMGHDADFGVGERHELALEVGHLRRGHRIGSRLAARPAARRPSDGLYGRAACALRQLGYAGAADRPSRSARLRAPAGFG